MLAGISAAWVAANELPALSWLVFTGLLCARHDLTKGVLGFGLGAAVVAAGFFGTNYAAHQSWRPAYTHRGGDDNWYDYPGTYWAEGERSGVDQGEPSRVVYLTNILVGHRGLLSLTPIWLLACWGAVRAVRHDDPTLRWLTLMTVVITVVLITFYVARPMIDRNYGGVCCGFRWMFWLTPLWLLLMLPAADQWLRQRWGQAAALVCLAVSVFSTHYPAMNPWVHPWLYRYWEYIGWISSA